MAVSADKPAARTKRLSFSALERFRFCPWVYYLNDVLKFPPPPADKRMSLGALVHQVIERYHKQGPLFAMPEAVMLAEFNTLWDSYMTPEMFTSQDEAYTMREQGEAMLRAFYRAEQERGYRALLAEAAFTVPLRPGFSLIGRIDRIDLTPDGDYVVLDYKSSQRPLARLMRPENSLQLALYALGTRALTGYEPTRIGFYYLAHNTIVEAPYNPASAEVVVQQFDELAQAYEKRALPPIPETGKCEDCPYRSHCPAWTSDAPDPS